MTTETRYLDILNAIVGGPYYDPQGTILPFRSGPTQLRIVTTSPNTTFLIVANSVQNGFVTTDVNGTAVFNILLPLGEVVLELFRENSTTKLVTYLTVRETAVWHESLAEQFETIDDSSDSTLNSFYLAEAGTTDIEQVHGVLLRYPNDTPAELEAYREMLQLVRQATRQYTGRLSGKFGVVAALTQVNPYIFERYKTGPKWILGYDLLFDDLQNYSKFVDTTDLININAAGQFLILNSIDDYVNGGTGVLTYNPYFNKLTWTPPGPIVITSPYKYESPTISADGQYTIPSGRIAAVVDSLYIVSSPVLAQYDHLYIELDNLGIVNINLSLNGGIGGIGGISFVTIVDAFFLANNTYNSKRTISTQPSMSLVDKVEVVKVSNNTDISISALGTIDTIASPSRIRYTAPGDTPGPYITFISSNTLIKLYSGNTIDYIDVIWGGTTGVSDTFIIGQRYVNNVAFFSPSKMRITSKNTHIIDGVSSVTIHDGGGNAATSPILGSYRGRYDIPKIYTTLSAGVTAGATSIQILANDIDKFSLAKGNNNFPFDIIVGYGHRASLTGASFFRVIADSNPHTAIIKSLAGSFYKISDTHVNIFTLAGAARYTINNGAHKIIEYINSTDVRVSYCGVGCSQSQIITGVSIIGVDPKAFSTSTTGAISFTFATSQLQWSAPGDSLGPNVTVTAGGYYRLYSNNGQYLDVLVDFSLLPGVDQSDSLYVRGFITITNTIGDKLSVWSSGEKASVISVTPGTPDVWNLELPVVGNYASGQSVYLRNGQFPLHVEGQDSFGVLNITADTTYAPTILSTDSLIISGSSLPDGWIKTSVFTPTISTISRFSKYEKGLLILGSGGATTIEKDIPFNNNICGLLFSIKAYLISIAGNGISNPINLSVDFGSGYISIISTSIVNSDDTVRQPQLVNGSILVPQNATKFKLQITAGDISAITGIEKIIVVQNPNQSLYLGHGTIPRNDSRSKFGSLMYIWSPDQLSQDELNMLGLDDSITLPSGTYNGASPVTGRIADSINTQEEFDAFDVTDVVGGNVVNVRGTVTDLDWASATLTNMRLVVRSPRRFSYVKPSIIGFQNEDLTFTTTPPNKATLSIISDQNQLNALLYEDDIPVPQNQWQFNTSTEIEIISGFNASAQYRFEYQALVRAETTPIDIVLPSPNGADTWIADCVSWNRHDTTANIYRTEVEVGFNANLQATLPQRSDADKLQSVLIENNGLNKRIIPQQAWNYIDSLNIKISGSEFSTNSIYTLTYNQQIPDTNRTASILTEVRSAASVFSLGAATYSPFTLLNDNIVDSANRYHQIRITASNVGDLRDVRLHSATLRGLRLYTSPIVPGL